MVSLALLSLYAIFWQSNLNSVVLCYIFEVAVLNTSHATLNFYYNTIHFLLHQIY